jgi:hypothetical protein
MFIVALAVLTIVCEPKLPLWVNKDYCILLRPNDISKSPEERVCVGRTAPVLLLSMLQSGMIFDRVTIQLLILSLLRRSTDNRHKSISIIRTLNASNIGFNPILLKIGD